MRNIDSWKSRIELNKKDTKFIHKIVLPRYKYYINKYSKGLLVDMGCGDVPYYNFYKNNISDNFCIDFNKSLEHTDLVADLNEKIDVESNKYDTVLCTDLIEHLKKPNVLFSEISRILKVKGNLILSVPFYYWIHEEPYDYHRYTEYMLNEFCSDNNLKIIEFEAYGGIPEIVADLVIKGYANNKLPFFYKVLMKTLMIFGTFLSKRNFIKEISKNSSKNFPLGYILVAQRI